MVRITDIYKKYRVPPNLQEHMLRVATVGKAISDGWINAYETDSLRITKTLLIHDMANILKYDFATSVHLLGAQQKNISYWKKVQSECSLTYGPDEHVAVLQIARELGMEVEAVTLLENMPAINAHNKIAKDDWELKICFYSDFRVAPYGVTSTDERMDDLIRREKARETPSSEIKRLMGIKEYLHGIERELQEKTTCTLSDLREHIYAFNKGEAVKSVRFDSV